MVMVCTVRPKSLETAGGQSRPASPEPQAQFANPFFSNLGQGRICPALNATDGIGTWSYRDAKYRVLFLSSFPPYIVLLYQ